MLQIRVESGHCFRIWKLAATALEGLGGRVIVGGKPAKTHEAGLDQSVVIQLLSPMNSSVRPANAKFLGAMLPPRIPYSP